MAETQNTLPPVFTPDELREFQEMLGSFENGEATEIVAVLAEMLRRVMCRTCGIMAR